MAKKNVRSKYLDPSRYWGNWDPMEHSIVYENNDAYRERRRELEYYRKHPAKANLDNLLHMLDEFVQMHEEERRSFMEEWKRLVRGYNEAINTINEQNQEISHLNDVITSINTRMNEAFAQQRSIQSRLDKIWQETQYNKDLASQYRNEAVEAFNSVANDVNYLKFAGDEIAALRYLLIRMDKSNLDEGAVQGLAVETLSKLYSIQKQVTRKQTEYELIYAIAKAKANSIMEQFVMWRDTSFFDSNEKNQADMHFWSRGLFTEQMQNVEIICHNIEVASQSPDVKTEELKQMIQELDQLEKNGQEAVSIVFSASAQSELAEALAQRTAIILAEDFFFRTVFMGFNNDDERSAYVIQLENHASGIRMQFVFTPMSGTQIGCNYSVSFRGYQDEDRVKTILQSLWSELDPNKIRVTTLEKESHIVEEIEFTPQGQSIHLTDSNHISQQQ